MTISAAKQSVLTHAKVLELFEYDEATGRLTWRRPRPQAAKRGAEAGCLCKSSRYRVVGIGDRTYRAHRLIWLWAHGSWPAGLIDHIDGDRSNNRLSNLRVASQSENVHNISAMRVTNTSGAHGVSWYERNQKWCARIAFNGRRVHLGYVTDIAEASQVRRAAEVKYLGSFAPIEPAKSRRPK